MLQRSGRDKFLSYVIMISHEESSSDCLEDFIVSMISCANDSHFSYPSQIPNSVKQEFRILSFNLTF